MGAALRSCGLFRRGFGVAVGVLVEGLSSRSWRRGMDRAGVWVDE